MNKLFRTTALAALLLAALPAAHAANQNYSFNGALDSGALIGQTFSGSFSFDDAALSSSGTEWLSVSSLSMNFAGSNFTQANAAAGSAVEVAYLDGSFLGLSYSVDSSFPKFSVIPGYDHVSQAFVAYDTAAVGGSGTGNINFAPVPEPESYAMLLAGLGLMGMVARRRKAL